MRSSTSGVERVPAGRCPSSRRRSLHVALALSSLACAGVPAAPAQRVSARFERLDGGVLTLGELRGRVVLLTAMATWAQPAIDEVPRLTALARAFPEDLRVVCVVLEERKLARVFASVFAVPYDVVLADDLAAFTGADGPFGAITLLPTSWLLDREGRVVLRAGGTWPPEVLEEEVGRLVAADRSRR